MQPEPWINELEQALNGGKAGVVLEINTADRIYPPDGGDVPLRLLYFLGSYFASQGFQVARFSLVSGLNSWMPPGSEPNKKSVFRDVEEMKSLQEILPYLENLLRRQDGKIALILDYADHIAPRPSGGSGSLTADQLAIVEAIHQWGSNDDIQGSSNTVVLVSHENDLHPLVMQSGGYRRIQLPLPSSASRGRFARFLVDLADQGSPVMGRLDTTFDVASFESTTAGLRLIDIEELFRTAGSTNGTVTREAVNVMKKRTVRQMCDGLLDVVEPAGGFDSVAGCDHAKSYLGSVRDLWHRAPLSVPQAVLLTGVPGCGKSHLVSALAAELQCPCLVMRNIREQWVGASERNMERVLSVMGTMGPCILWTDEIDQAIGRERTSESGGDSGVSDRIVGRLFEFFGGTAHRGVVLWVATTNRPDLLDPALVDRFQVVIPFLTPTKAEREALIPMLCRQIGRCLAEDIDIQLIAGMPELDTLTVRSLLEIIAQAAFRTDEESERPAAPIETGHLLEAVRDYSPHHATEQNVLIALRSIQMTRFNHLLPWMDRHGLRPGASWPGFLEDLVEPATGRLDRQGLAEMANSVQARLFEERMRR